MLVFSLDVSIQDALEMLKGMGRVKIPLSSNKIDVPAKEIKPAIVSPARGISALRGMHYWLEALGYGVVSLKTMYLEIVT